MTKKAELRAVAYGSDGFAGDSAFYPGGDQSFVATEDSTFEQLLDAWKSWKMREDGLEEEELLDEELCELPAGFWLLTDDNLDVATTPGDIECGNDGQAYTVNRAIKVLCARLATKTVGTPPDGG